VAARGATRPERLWVQVMLEFHELLREALAIKRWLGAHKKQGTSAKELFPAFRRYFARSPLRRRPLDGVDAAFLLRYQRPPRGRLLVLVWDELSARHGLTGSELERMIFGAS
jgi:hypothetical protein